MTDYTFSVPPFSYVEKREQTQNVEMFQDFFAQVAPEKLGDTNQTRRSAFGRKLLYAALKFTLGE